MKIYLVDFENVKSKGLQGIDNLTETDTVIIFYSENSDTINFEMHQKVLTSKADIEYFKVNVGGKNALDFQLSTLLGYLVAKDTYTNIFVISNDRGFDFLHDFWHGKYVDSPNAMVYRTRTIQTAINFANHKVNPTENNEDEESTKHSFVSLPAGKYQFQIKATNGDGIWMNSVKTVTLQVLPTFWETGWAKA